MLENILEEFHTNCQLKIRKLKAKHERERRQLTKVKMEEQQQFHGRSKPSFTKRFGIKCEYRNGLLSTDKNGNAV